MGYTWTPFARGRRNWQGSPHGLPVCYDSVVRDRFTGLFHWSCLTSTDYSGPGSRWTCPKYRWSCPVCPPPLMGSLGARWSTLKTAAAVKPMSKTAKRWRTKQIEAVQARVWAPEKVPRVCTPAPTGHVPVRTRRCTVEVLPIC